MINFYLDIFINQVTKESDTSSHLVACMKIIQEGLAVASIAQDDPSTHPDDDPFPRAWMDRDRNAR